ncbi:hypothetical protein JZ751_028215 [Albula glossodonta]|uniref:Zinc-binding protein A33-like n=1 Tax=Albula glossodonta TaxID=121402 RepID=A0A8T2NJC2_9TELE|nr:hypothetical protein JZ751_028215 [Albula glossodonta]
MAECSYGDNNDRPSLLEEDLSCPVCRDIFREPVLLSCSHSFCRGCLEHSWEQKRIHECPVCRKKCDGEQPIPNRALKNTCESYQKEKGWRVPTASEALCGLHRRELVLFCMKDEEPVCVDCVTLHRGHELYPLEQGVPFCKNQAQQAEKQIKMEFERLHKVLQEEEASRIGALREEEELKKKLMRDRVNSLTRDLNALSENIQSVKREMGAETLPFLQPTTPSLCRAQWIKEDPPRVSGTLIDVAKHLGSLGFQVWEKVKSHITYRSVVMDPNTASPWLSLSADMSSVCASQERQPLPDNAERFDPCVFVLGSARLTAGRHRWDVSVGDNPKWIVGVCKESVARKRKFTVTTSGGVWTIGLSKGVYNALTTPRTPLALDRRLETVRVKVNVEKGEVSFWDPSDMKHICTFTDTFDQPVYPIFGPGLHNTPMAILPGKLTVSQA